jgi:hypothetical protein
MLLRYNEIISRESTRFNARRTAQLLPADSSVSVPAGARRGVAPSVTLASALVSASVVCRARYTAGDSIIHHISPLLAVNPERADRRDTSPERRQTKEARPRDARLNSTVMPIYVFVFVGGGKFGRFS